MDIREVNMKEKFDVVINLADGAIGYLENDMERVKNKVDFWAHLYKGS